MAKGALDLLIEQVKEDIDTRIATLRRGCADFNEYQNVCGQIRGLELAHDHINSLLQRLRDNDE